MSELFGKPVRHRQKLRFKLMYGGEDSPMVANSKKKERALYE